MTFNTAALLAPAPNAEFERGTVPRRDVAADDVLIDIKFAGICHSDIHQVREEWGSSTFPMVPGHEIAGIVAEVGENVTKFKVGDRVGVGCFVDSCGECEWCEIGEEQHCRKNVGTYNSREHNGDLTYGGYSKQIVVKQDYVLRIPDAIELDVAAPLLCAGITTYSPLRQWGAGPDKRVAVIGMGGLGHMAVKFAHAMGAHVTVISQTRSKEADGRRFGADDYRAMNEPGSLKELRSSFDLIICTVSADMNIDAYLRTLRVGGALVFVGLPENPQSFRVSSVISGRRSLAGSNIGGIRETQEMLDFSAEHGLAADIELIGADEVDAAYDRVVASDVRYRFVIDTATI